MPQSLSQVYLHLIFSTKDRQKLIPQDVKPLLYGYLAGVCKNLNLQAYEIGGMSDHVHLLVSFPRILSIADLVRELKSGSTKWLESEHGCPHFAWQHGYAVFSVSHSDVGRVRNYIQNQETHHKQRSFQEEYLLFLSKHGVACDERYVWE